MVYYTRFFKPPRISPSKDGRTKSISAVVTIQNDLGDVFLLSSVRLVARIYILDTNQNEKIYNEQSVNWTGESQSLTIRFPIVPQGQRFKLHVSESVSHRDHAPIVPRIISAWSALFGVRDEVAEALIERRFLLPGKASELRIWEETGNSIACHIWDAALGFILLFQSLCGASSKDQLMPILRAHLTLSKSSYSQAIELGSGCGIVGICLAQLFPFSNVVLTDLPEAQRILERNLSASRKASSLGSLMHQTLAWGNDSDVIELEDLSSVRLILASDCIYNPSSTPALVQTFASIIRRSQAPEIFLLIAMKRRHESEVVFFDLMREAAFVLVENTKVALPNFDDGSCSVEKIEFFLFGAHQVPDSS